MNLISLKTEQEKPQKPKFVCADCGCPPEDCEKFIKGEIDKCTSCRLEKCCCIPADFGIPA
ncbi:MAG: hypothetical protein ACRDFC_06430 [Ignavibacteria bacterium]